MRNTDEKQQTEVRVAHQAVVTHDMKRKVLVLPT